eukprot:COSAG05_NODE_2_length_63105_cov_159.292956_8_plen_88_part_00
MWDAKAPTPSLTIIPTPDNMVFLEHVQIDSIVLRNARDGHHAYIVNVVDVYTRYSWQRSIMLIESEVYYNYLGSIKTWVVSKVSKAS